MKIAFIYDAVYPWIKDGAEKKIYEIAIRLADREVHLIAILGKGLINFKDS